MVDIQKDEALEKKGKERVEYLAEMFLYHLEARKPEWALFRARLRAFMGEQYPDEVKAALELAKKPALVFNHLSRVGNLLSGYERSERRKVIARPRYGAMKSFAQVVNDVLAFVDERSNAAFEKTEGAENSFVMGQGILGYVWDPDKGEYRIKSEDVFSHVPDRDCYDRTWESSRIHFRFRWMSKKDLMRVWPKKKDELKDIRPMHGIEWEGERGMNSSIRSQQSDYGNRTSVIDSSTGKVPVKDSWKEFYDLKAKKFRVIECSEIHECPTLVFEQVVDGKWVPFNKIPYTIDEDGELKKPDGQFMDAVKASGGNIRTKESSSWRVRLSTWVGDVLLEESWLDFERIPFVPLYCFYKHDDERRYIESFISRLMDPQLAYDKARSQLIYAVQKSLGKIIVLSQSLVAGVGEDRFRQALENTVDVVAVNTDDLEGSFREIDFGKINGDLFTLTREIAMEMDLISGLDQQAMMGMSQKGDPSGWALEIKQKQNVIQITTPFDLIRESTIAFYRDIVWPIVKNSDIREKVRRSSLSFESDPMDEIGAIPLGAKYSQMSPREVEALVVSGLATTEDVAADKIFNPLGSADVDIIFDDVRHTPTERLRFLNVILAMMDKGAQIPMEVAMEFMDEPIKQKMIDYQRKNANAQPAVEGGSAPAAVPIEAQGAAVA